jgi:hypothetical protein
VIYSSAKLSVKCAGNSVRVIYDCLDQASPTFPRGRRMLRPKKLRQRPPWTENSARGNRFLGPRAMHNCTARPVRTVDSS